MSQPTCAKRPSMRTAIDAKCKDCIHDPYQRGNWREQIAACESSNCALHDVRPVPRACQSNGVIDYGKVQEIRVKLGIT